MVHHDGSIEVICGCMFSGKTEELIRRLRRAVIARQKVQVFKPDLDNRYDIQNITSHNGQNIEAKLVANARQILENRADGTSLVAIDEAQFFNADIVEVVEVLANSGMRVLVAGLDTDFRGEPFGSMPELLCRAEEVTKLHAICVICGEPASRTQRLFNGGVPVPRESQLIQVGGYDHYQARCPRCHIVPTDSLYPPLPVLVQAIL